MYTLGVFSNSLLFHVVSSFAIHHSCSLRVPSFQLGTATLAGGKSCRVSVRAINRSTSGVQLLVRHTKEVCCTC